MSPRKLLYFSNEPSLPESEQRERRRIRDTELCQIEDSNEERAEEGKDIYSIQLCQVSRI